MLTHQKLAEKHLADVASGWHIHLAVLLARLDERALHRFWALIADLEEEYGKNLAAK